MNIQNPTKESHGKTRKKEEDIDNLEYLNKKRKLQHKALKKMIESLSNDEKRGLA